VVVRPVDNCCPFTGLTHPRCRSRKGTSRRP
jgi:hypothetical protein